MSKFAMIFVGVVAVWTAIKWILALILWIFARDVELEGSNKGII